METVSCLQVDRRHSQSFPSILSEVVVMDGLFPESSFLAGHILPEANVNQEICTFRRRLKVRIAFLIIAILNGWTEKARCVPATQITGALRLVIKRRTQRNDAFDLRDSQPTVFFAQSNSITLSGASNAMRTQIHPP